MTEKTFKIVDGEISDGYHTFDELYDHRCLLYLTWLVQEQRLGSERRVYFVRNHYPNWDLLVAYINDEQVSYHIRIYYRDILEKHFKEVDEKEHEFDGYTPEDVADRLRDNLRSI